uniref:RNase adapter protein RapZ n=1 Tax=uncultured Armatimonadetes bacterium TaxID=157466 RepID=A0A6J4HQU1_9BACT|nr:RNase adapter protein RapZ [uncultured Armatimonadetes bacterium]
MRDGEGAGEAGKPHGASSSPHPSSLAPRPCPILVLSGMSGAGKQLAATHFEDMGWRVVDNLPPRLLPDLVAGEMGAFGRKGDPPPRLLVICDARAEKGILDLLPAIALLRGGGMEPRLLYLDASDEILVRRFKETRRTHPLFLPHRGILPAIQAERELLHPIKERADRVIDTTGLSPGDLRGELLELFGDPEQRLHPLTVTVSTFGFKHGLPLDADLVFDVRFLRNPHYVDELRPLDGRDAAVDRYVCEDERTGCFLERLYDMVGWSLPQYVTEGKAYLTVAVGCTGGKHRSVVIGEKLAQFLRDRGYRVLLQHRDLGRL